jgi:uncharacterized protein involved in exopolysaccharide biosynthesis
MEIKSYLFLLRRWAWLLILGVLLGGGAAYAFSVTQSPLYQATTRVMVMQSPDPQGYTDTYNSL